MPTTTYIPLANVTLSASAASVTFSSISQAYRDLVLVIKGNGDAGIPVFTLNNDTNGSNYFLVTMSGNGSTASSNSNTGDPYIAFNRAINPTVGTLNPHFIADIFDYSATDKHKTVLTKLSSAANGVEYATSRWSSTAAVTSLQVKVTSASTLMAGTTIALYGVSA